MKDNITRFADQSRSRLAIDSDDIFVATSDRPKKGMNHQEGPFTSRPTYEYVESTVHFYAFSRVYRIRREKNQY
eukprot:1634204-Ditylum_brightwellii.AAC.2